VGAKTRVIHTMNILARSLFALAIVAAGGLLAQALPIKKDQDASQDKKRLERLEQRIEELRPLLKIPGMSAAIIKDQKVLWARGFGFADLEKRIPATPDTLFHLA